MHRLAAAILALSVTQQEPPSPAPAAIPPSTEAARASEPAPPASPAPEPAAVAPPPAPAAAPAPPPEAPPPRVVAPPQVPTPSAPARPPQPVPAPAPAPAPLREPAAIVPPAAPRGTAPRAAPIPERDRLINAALAFMDALLRGDASDLAGLSAPRFSFDGTFVDGRDAQTRRWRELLAARAPVASERLRDLAVMTVDEAVAQLGAPPARLAPLLERGRWVAVADVSSRPVVLVLVKDGDRIAVAGMHD